MVINASHSPSAAQLTLNLEPGLAEQYRCVRDVCAAGIYRRGLKRMAADLDQAPGNLSVMLSDDGVRHFSCDLLELYMQRTGDLLPIHYLIARYMRNQADTQAQALKRVEGMLEEISDYVGQMSNGKKKGRR